MATRSEAAPARHRERRRLLRRRRRPRSRLRGRRAERARAGMARIAGGKFFMGTDDKDAESTSARRTR